MATLFPFNQGSKIPGLVIDKLKPAVLKQVDKFNKLSDNLEQQLVSLKNAKCNDAKIQQFKFTLAQFKLVIDNLNRINQRLQPLATRLQQASNIAKPVATILLAVPAVPGIPEGPKNQTIQTIADLIAGIAAVIIVLNILLKIFNKLLNIANKLITKAENKLKTICPTDNNLNSGNLTGAVATNDTNSSDLPADVLAINDLYFSQFYQTINTSNKDIENRVSEINLLIDEQLDVITNLIEAPSKVLYDVGIPNNELGNIGDYYIDTDTQTIYGPKASQNSWT